MKIRFCFIIILITFFLGTAICEAAEISGKGTFNLRDGASESNTVINLSNAELLKLNDGYELAIKSVDIDGNQVYLELLKGGDVVDSRVIIPANEVDGTFIYSKPGTSQMIMVHIKNAFRGADQDMVTVDHILQTSETNRYRILLNDTRLLTVSKGTSLKLYEGYELAVRSVDIDGNKAYLELLKNGQAIDSKVLVAGREVDDTFIYSRPGNAQIIKAHFKNAFRGADRNLVTIDNIRQTSETDPSRILMDYPESLTVTSGTPLHLEEGYELVIKSVDIDGNKIYVELLKEGQPIASKVILAANEADGYFVYSKTGTSQEIKVHFKNAFRGADQNLATVDHVQQTSETDPSRILMDDTQSLVVAQGTPLRLQEGYELAIESIDIDGNKAYVELFKDGSVVDSRVIVAANEINNAFIYSRPGTLQEIKVHFKNVFRGADQNLVTVDRIQQTSETDPSRNQIDDLKSFTVTSGTPLQLEEGYELAVKSVDIDGNKVYVQLSRNGQIVDSQVIIAANEVDDTFAYSRPGTAQTINVRFKNAFRGADQDLVTVDSVLQTSEINPSRILINDSASWTIASGTPLKLEEGYELTIKSIDIDGNKAYVELSKDGSVVDSNVIVAAREVDDTFVYSKPGMAQKIVVHFKNAFRGKDLDLATIDSILQ